MSMTTHVQNPTEITEHEQKEEQRVRRIEQEYRSKEEALKKDYAKALLEAEAEEKAKASSELQAFGAGEVPRMMEDGERARIQAVEAVEKAAVKNIPTVLKTTLAKARTQSLSF